MTGGSQFSLFGDADFAADSPLKGRVVCILGTFRQPAKKIQQFFTALGADCRLSTKVSRNVHYVLVGRGAPADQLDYIRTLEYHGYCPRVLSQEGLDDMMQGHRSQYSVPAEISKNLHLTPSHYSNCRLRYGSSPGNPLYTRELFVAPDTVTPQPQLYQLLGDNGIYANPYIDDTTDVIVISDATLSRLHDGLRDDTMRTIEASYNASRSQTFRYVMTCESELLGWLERLR